MKKFLTKLQRQDLGEYILRGGYTPASFLLTEDFLEDGARTATLEHRDSPARFIIQLLKNGAFTTDHTIPGTSKTRRSGSLLNWGEALDELGSWVNDVKLENEAIDPWEDETEGMAEDDSLFTLEELPQVDRAIDESLKELKRLALESGQQQKKIESELEEVKQHLKKVARHSTKREWINTFRGIIIGKLVDWGMQTQLFHTVLHTLITSAHDIAQLVEHAAQYLPG